MVDFASGRPPLSIKVHEHTVQVALVASFMWPQEGQCVLSFTSGRPGLPINAHSHTLQLVLLASFMWPQEGQPTVDVSSSLPPLPTKLWSQIEHLLTLQRSLRCPQDGHSTSICIQGLPGRFFFIASCLFGSPRFTTSQTHTTLSTLHLVMMVTLTTLRTGLVDHFLTPPPRYQIEEKRATQSDC